MIIYIVDQSLLFCFVWCYYSDVQYNFKLLQGFKL
jgi:hypothetical protein